MMVDEAALDQLLEEQDVRVPAGAMDRLGDFLVRDERGGLRFRSGLMRDVAYEGLPFRRRQVLHDHVSRAIERSSATPESQCEVLSLHFFHAGRHDKAYIYSLLAGERAVAKYAHGEAIEFYARAAHSGGHTEADPSALARVHEKLADSRWLVGLTGEAADAYAIARRHLRDDPVAIAGIVEKEARIDQRRRNHPVAMRRISRGLRGLEGMNGTAVDTARSHLARRYADSRFRQGRVDDAFHWAQLAARYAEESVDKATLAAAYEVLNYIYAGSGREEPLPYGLMALQAYVELGNLRHQGWCHNNLAMQDFAAGRWDESLDRFHRATEMFRRIGDTAAEANASCNEAEILVRQGRYADAVQLLPDVLRIARAVEDEELVAIAQRETALAVAGLGDVDRGLEVLRDARDRFEALGATDEVSATDVAAAEIQQDAARWSAAREALDVVGDPADPHPALYRLRGRQLRAEDRLDEARTALERALAAAQQRDDQLEEGRILAELARLTGDEPMERRAGELLESLGVVLPG
jgi:tetratricopeptide (TPR) repeat protein